MGISKIIEEKTGIDRYIITVPWWQFWNRCKRCRGRKWIKAHAMLDDRVQNIYTCRSCGYSRSRKNDD